jgi:hypothetical protein
MPLQTLGLGGLNPLYASTTAHQLRQTMRNLLDNLEEAGMNFGGHKHLLGRFVGRAGIRQKCMPSISKARTTVEQVAPTERNPDILAKRTIILIWNRYPSRRSAARSIQ